MKHLCECFVQNRARRILVSCGRSGKVIVVSGELSNVQMTACASHRRRLAKKYEVQIYRSQIPLPFGRKTLDFPVPKKKNKLSASPENVQGELCCSQ